MLGINKMSNIKSNSGDSNQFINIGLTILAIVILLFLIGSYYNNRKDNKEKFDNPSEKNLQYESGPLDLIQTNDVQCQQRLDGNASSGVIRQRKRSEGGRGTGLNSSMNTVPKLKVRECPHLLIK